MDDKGSTALHLQVFLALKIIVISKITLRLMTVSLSAQCDLIFVTVLRACPNKKSLSVKQAVETKCVLFKITLPSKYFSLPG